MRWVKRGKIFDPTKVILPNNCIEFAQSPQTLVFDDFVRIYFSTREIDHNGKYLSHIAFVDFDKNLKKIINISSETVIKLGALGCYDEHGIFPLNILKDQDRILGYIGGWSRRISVSVETSIGIAESFDNGLSFLRIGDGPLLTSSLNEPFLVGDPFVIKIDNIYYMWYIYGTKWSVQIEPVPAERIYKIGYAISEDRISWSKKNKQIISDKLNTEECQALPSVIKIDNRFHMVFCYRQATDFRRNRERGYRIGYAFSDDLKNWTRDDTNVGIDVSRKGWDSNMMCYPHIFQLGGNIFLLYNGNEFGRYGFGLAILER